MLITSRRVLPRKNLPNQGLSVRECVCAFEMWADYRPGLLSRNSLPRAIQNFFFPPRFAAGLGWLYIITSTAFGKIKTRVSHLPLYL